MNKECQINKKLLFIEDNPMMGGYLTHLFHKTHTTMWCTTAEEALSHLKEEHETALIICDYELHSMNGLELLQTVKSSKELHSIPVIILSGKDSELTRRECLENGATDFFPKPFNPAKLKATIQNLLENVTKTSNE